MKIDRTSTLLFGAGIWFLVGSLLAILVWMSFALQLSPQNREILQEIVGIIVTIGYVGSFATGFAWYKPQASNGGNFSIIIVWFAALCLSWAVVSTASMFFPMLMATIVAHPRSLLELFSWATREVYGFAYITSIVASFPVTIILQRNRPNQG